ncbi:CdaR family protein [Ileibacterium valens]|uniref:YbbR-like protein n=3 Tax=Ileibacterium valens TaxID=1862668 RepID=A0A1U7NFU6_9FIRM|nr:CdaR family protein [Ileibacterium valens]OLU36184.1 hypothetical protein BM735_12860 [Erysipelotrichaceae bacterium NYU-BL-F16]OLU39457.1 hypothetical protein BO222_06735 [Ileibacterium valens]OLU39521.1 hypothetical protein BO224_07270 [Erysipelotrichaceae bacterium NYU-BL-E8]
MENKDHIEQKTNKDSWFSDLGHDFLQIAKSLGNRVSKLFDKVIYNQRASLIVSGVFALIFCVSLSFDELRLTLFSQDKTTLLLNSVPVEATYDESTYEITGLPTTANMEVEGDPADLQLVRTQNSASVQADLTNVQEGSNSVVLKASGLPSGVSAVVDPESAEINVLKKYSRTFFVTPELIVGDNQTESQFETPQLSAKSVSIKATKDKLNSIRSVKAIVDTAGHDSDFSANAILVAYDSNGRQVNVTINPPTINASVKVKNEPNHG